MTETALGPEWFFCRSVFNAASGSICLYPEFAEHPEASQGRRYCKRGFGGAAEGVADSDEVMKRSRLEEPAAPVRRTGKLVSGRTCVECGATQTPQWREGPAGPKTLCNACGVRYVRAQQRANKRAVAMGLPRPSSGSGGRQSRASKGTRGEPATARASARVSASAHATEESSQRPQRQAALLAANKTAQYARTGVFPQSSSDLRMGGSSYHFSRRDAEAEADTGAPDCSSNESAGSMQEGVTVEVLIGGAEAEADCCGGAAASGAAGSAPAGYAGSFGALVPPPQASSACASGPSDGVLAQQAVLTVAAAMALPLANPMPVQLLPAASGADACCLASAAAALLPGLGASCPGPQAPCLSGMIPVCGGSSCVVSDSPAAPVVSLPVSPVHNNNPLPGSGSELMSCAAMAGGADLEADAEADLYGGVGPTGDCALDDGWNVDFGLGAGALFDDHLADDRFDATSHDDLVAGPADLPAAADRAAPFCADLAPGSQARTLLDAMPVLGAAAAGAAPLLPADAAAHLVDLGRNASRAATEALAADAARHAVTQALEAHQDAARRAREAAASSLGRLKDRLTASLASGAEAGMGMGAGMIPASDTGGLIDLCDLGSLGGLGCLDGSELMVAVHS
ncbi:hypothetical protein HYH03_018847 [Edaphochlamys debaryana]|uniref:GATA-type domain-containing protein n=1 Tax=Edaphochlamys debaryana TaxID=47281 RepID=A0A836BMW9_9CHLO|nr:hypothetical protein HYH03_018847 [Edaphochlamys debaryana]|eukprot:KAG2482202.1 hypothetical protein HYH03_018847 [Edaphochlamys debaryana]